MTEEVKNRLEQIQAGKVPTGYKQTPSGIIPKSWHDARMSNVTKVIKETAGSKEYETLSISAGIGFVNQARKFGREMSGSQYSKYTVIRHRDFSYNKGNSNLYPQGCIYRLNDRKEAAVPNVFESFRFDSSDGDYYEQLFMSGYLNEQLYSKINHGVRDDGLLNLTGKDFFSCRLPVPSLPEQQKIAEILMQCDKVIKLRQCRIEEIKKLKKACLNKMFPKKGSNVPEIRFPGFTGAWEQRKVGELTNVASAARVHKEEWVTQGVPFFRSSDVVSAYKGNENGRAYISWELYEQLSNLSGKLEKDDILITGGGSIGIPYIVPNNEPLYSKDADLIWIKHSDNFDSQYMFTYLTAPSFRAYLNAISHIGTFAHYTIEQVKDTPISLPSTTEQQALGSFFRNLDNLIALHQRMLNEKQELKKALMQLLLTGIVRVTT